MRYALRQLGKTPAFTITMLLTLALGIGANTAIFTLVNSALMKNLPVVDPKTLVRIDDTGPVSSGDFEIVGVVEDTIYTAVQRKNHSMFFFLMMQRRASNKNPIETDISLYAGAFVIQTDRPMNDMEKLTQSTLSSISPNLTIVKFQTF